MTSTTDAQSKRGIPRLRRWYWKFLYIVVGVAIYYLGGALAPTDNSRGILRSALVFVLILLAARVFRGAAEIDDSARPWWRMTGAPLAGFVLGVIFAILSLALILYSYGIETESVVHTFRSQQPYVIVTAVLFAALAVLYLTSSVRLRGIAREARLEAERSRKAGPQADRARG